MKKASVIPIGLSVMVAGLVFQALFVSTPGFLKDLDTDLSSGSLMIIAIGILLLCALTLFTFVYVRYSLRRQKVVGNGTDTYLAISPVWGGKLKLALPEIKFFEPVLVFGKSRLHIIDVAKRHPFSLNFDYQELSDVYFSTQNVPDETAGFLNFTFHKVKFKQLVWSPDGANSVGLRPMLPSSERDLLYNAIQPR